MTLTKVSYSLINGTPINVQDYGAVGDGSTDDSAAITAAIAAAQAANIDLYFPAGTYMANSLIVTVGFAMSPSAVLKFNGTSNGYLVDFTASNKRIEYASLDGANTNCTLITINGDKNFIGSVYVANSTASVSGVSTLYGVRIAGDFNVVETIYADTLANTGYSNESFPQAVFVSGENNNIGSINGNTCQALLVTGVTSNNTTVGSVVSRNSVDNGIYWLGGNLSVGQLDYYGTNEPVVCTAAAPAKLTIDRLHNFGTGIIGFDNATGDVEFGDVYLGPNVGSIMRTRSGNTASGSVKIQKITGVFTGSSLWDFSTGTLEYLSISDMDVTFNYDAAVSGPITSWARYTGCKSFNFGLLNIKIVDVNDVLTGSDFFQFLGPTTNLTYRSFVNRLNISLFNSDEVTQSAAAVRASELFSSDIIHVENGRVQVNVEPYLREVSDDTVANGIVIIGSAAPTLGTWRRGQVVWYSDSSAGSPSGAVCVTAGTPGTWKAMAALAV